MQRTDEDGFWDLAEPPVTRRVRVKNPTGLHLRLAAAIVKTTQFLRAEIHLEYRGTRVNAKSVLALVTLGAGYDAELVIHASGIDAGQAVDALARLMAHDYDAGHTDIDESGLSKSSPRHPIRSRQAGE